MASMNSVLLADDMGLGKGLESLTATALDFDRGWAKRVLIVSPATLKQNWAAEIEDHTNFTYRILDGSPKQRAAQLAEFREGEVDILIVNYEQVMPHLYDLNAMNFDIAIFDEAHYIKSRRSRRTKACQAIQAKRFFLLTGSPMLNQVDELWSLLHRIDPVEFPNYWKFVARYAVWGGYKDKQIIGVKNHGELTERLRSVMIRRRKDEVLDLPEKQVIKVWVDLHPSQRKLYDKARDELVIDLPDNPDPMELENALTKYLRLKQICGTTATIEGYPDHSHKLDRAVELVQDIIADGEKVVVFTQFRGVLAAFVNRLAEAKVPTWQLHGDVLIRERVPTVMNWAESIKPGALACMTQVAGVGLSMTAASKCVFLDKLYVPKLNEQAQDRLHRIGANTTIPIQIFEIIARNTVEQRIEAILSRKEKLFSTLIETSDWKRKLYMALREEGL